MNINKINISILIIGLTLGKIGFSQTNPRLLNENYMQTVFSDDFLGTQVNRNSWWVVPGFKREIGVLDDNPQTLRVFNGNLELTMIHSPNYSAGGYTGDYVGAELHTTNSFKYGSFECSAKFARQNASFPAFWLYGVTEFPVVREVDMAQK